MLQERQADVMVVGRRMMLATWILLGCAITWLVFELALPIVVAPWANVTLGILGSGLPLVFWYRYEARQERRWWLPAALAFGTAGAFLMLAS